MKQPVNVDKTSRAYLTQQYGIARANLLGVVAFTALNLILLAAGGSLYLLFSASLPYYLPIYGQLFDSLIEGGSTLFTIAGYAGAVLCLALYLLCWWLSKKHPAFMTVALVLFILDCGALAFLMWDTGLIVDFLLDILFHVWVLSYLIRGVSYAAKLRRMPPETEVPAAVPLKEDAAAPDEFANNDGFDRPADSDSNSDSNSDSENNHGNPDSGASL